MDMKYKVKNNELILYLDYNSEFAKSFDKDSETGSTDLKENILKLRNKINFKGNVVKVVVGGALITTLLVGANNSFQKVDNNASQIDSNPITFVENPSENFDGTTKNLGGFNIGDNVNSEVDDTTNSGAGSTTNTGVGSTTNPGVESPTNTETESTTNSGAGSTTNTGVGSTTNTETESTTNTEVENPTNTETEAKEEIDTRAALNKEVSDMTNQKLLGPSSIKYGYQMETPKYIVVHNTANNASAAGEVNYLHSSENTSYTSFHFAVDEKEIWQALPTTVTGWHAGDGGAEDSHNANAIGVEIARSTSDDLATRDQAIENAAKLVASLLMEYDLGIEDIVTHKDVTGKHCPHDIFDRYGYENFEALIESHM